MAEKKTVNVTLNMSTLIFSKVYLNNTKTLFVSHNQDFFFQYNFEHGEELFVCFTSFFMFLNYSSFAPSSGCMPAPLQAVLERGQSQSLLWDMWKDSSSKSLV